MGGDQAMRVVERLPAWRFSQGMFVIYVANVRCHTHAFVMCVVKVQSMIQQGATANVARPKVNMARETLACVCNTNPQPHLHSLFSGLHMCKGAC
jgi:hypothetical protein